MTGVYLFDLASQQARYLAVRQATIASNVANANTPDYKARDVVPFAEVMARTASASGLTMTASARVSTGEGTIPTKTINAADAWDALTTSSSVSLEQEMLKAGQVSREHTLNMGIVKVFDRMLRAAVRGELMIDPLTASTRLASAGMEAQSLRLRIAAENVANAQSVGDGPGADPYARKTVSFRAAMDRAAGGPSVALRGIGTDDAPFRIERDPGNPAADADGNVKMPNVNVLIEMADIREANRSYEANVQVIKQARAMVASVIDLLKS